MSFTYAQIAQAGIEVCQIILKRGKDFSHEDKIMNNHHIIPRYMGGDNDHTNLISLTIHEHLEVHVNLFNKYRNVSDWMAVNILYSKYFKGDSPLAGVKFFYNPDDCEQVKGFMPGEQVPEGWLEGWGSSWIYNPQTGVEKRIPKDQQIPKGWRVGRQYVSSRTTGMKWYYNPKTGERTCARECPEGFLKGRGRQNAKWYYDPKTGQVTLSEQCPPGWKTGRNGYKPVRWHRLNKS